MLPTEYETVCWPCVTAQRARVLCAPIPEWEVHTAWDGNCDCCGQFTGVSHVRNFHRPWHKALRVEPPG